MELDYQKMMADPVAKALRHKEGAENQARRDAYNAEIKVTWQTRDAFLNNEVAKNLVSEGPKCYC